MIKLLNFFGIIVVAILIFAVYKNVVDKRAPLSNQTVLKPGNYTKDLKAWPKRPYDIHIPSGYDASRPTAVVLALHGGGASGENAAKLTCPGGDLNSPKCLNKLSDKEGFVVVYPNGASRSLFPNIRTWNAGGGDEGYLCISEYACENKIDDIKYFKDLFSELSKTINIDRTRMYSVGISNGAAMSHRLACELSDWVVGVASIGGGNQFSTVTACNPSKSVSVLEIHGTKDPAWPYNGGPGLKEGGNFVSFSETISGWVSRNGCSTTSINENIANTQNDGTQSAKESYVNCSRGGNIVAITVTGGGHTWPQGNQYALERSIGKTSQDFNANEIIWQFFKEHPRK